MTLRDWVLVALLGIGWGCSFVANAVLLEELAPLSLSMWRVGTGAALVWAVLAFRGTLSLPAARDLRALLVFGVVTYAAPFALYPAAQTHLAAGVTGIINAMTPICVVSVSHFWPGGERATSHKMIGVVLGFAGILLLALPTMHDGGQSAAWAVGLAMLAPVCYAIGLNLFRGIAHLDNRILTAVALSWATLALLPVAGATGGLMPPVGRDALIALVVIGPILTGAAFILMSYLVGRIGATNASTVTFIAPISAIVMGYLILGQSVSTLQILGMLVIFGGLVAIDGRVRKLLSTNRLN